MTTDSKEALILFLIGASFVVVMPCAMRASSETTPRTATSAELLLPAVSRDGDAHGAERPQTPRDDIGTTPDAH